MSDDLVKWLRGPVKIAAQDLIDRYFGNSDKCLATIPADPDRDADLVLLKGLKDAAANIEALTAERDALKAAQIDAIRAALEVAAEVCAGIRQRISNGPMPEGARFDYEQAIRAIDPAAIAAKLKGDDNDRA